MYSALKHQGQPLYKLAREGREVERQPRRITIFSIKLLAYENASLSLDVKCSKGTYIRTLIEDIGEVLGCGAHVVALRRTEAGPYALADSMDMAQLQQLVEVQAAGLLAYRVSMSVEIFPGRMFTSRFWIRIRSKIAKRRWLHWIKPKVFCELVWPFN